MAEKEFKPEKVYKATYLKNFKEFDFIPDEVPWINAPLIDQNISVQWWVVSVIWWTNISVDNTDPKNPIINNTYTP